MLWIGVFVFFELGMFIALEGTKLCYFSGVRMHAGRSAMAPPGVVPDPSAYRVMHVCYPSSSFFDGIGVHALAASRPGVSSVQVKRSEVRLSVGFLAATLCLIFYTRIARVVQCVSVLCT